MFTDFPCDLPDTSEVWQCVLFWSMLDSSKVCCFQIYRDFLWLISKIQFCLVPGSTLCHVNTFKHIETCPMGQNVVYFVKCSTCTWKEYEFGLLCVMFYKCRWGQFGSSVAQIFYALADCLSALSISDWDRSVKNLWLLPDCVLLS